jgi:uncharacterized membrane protein YraQ (UPF0718 family)
MSIFYPIQFLVDFVVVHVLHLNTIGLPGSAIDFFIFDTVKIFLLLIVIVFASSLLRSFIPAEKTRKILSNNKTTFGGNILAALLGVATPFCSCSAIPLFLGFIQSGVPLGVTFSFLISSPMVNEVAVIMLLGLFGWKVMLVYITSGLIIATISGMVIGRMHVESLVESFVFENKISADVELPELSWDDRVSYAHAYVVDIMKKVWIYVIIGIGIGAWIHGYVPADFLAHYAARGVWYAVPLAVLIGVPLYSNAAGIIPLVGALTEKGVAMGPVLAFMMSVTALSLPEFMILKKVMKLKLILIFAAIVSIGIIFTGYLFNFIL